MAILALSDGSLTHTVCQSGEPILTLLRGFCGELKLSLSGMKFKGVLAEP